MDGSQIALQLYTVRSLTAQDMAGTLQNLARIGYRYVEPAGYGNLDAKGMKQALDASGIRAISAHVALERFENELDQVIEELKGIGCEHAIVPWLKPERRTAEQFPALADTLNQAGEACAAAGLRFGYHNHEFEFEPAGDLGDGTLYDFLAERTDPALVSLQIDLYWLGYTGRDPVEFIDRFAGRVPLLHMKDLAKDGSGHDAVLGEGALTWPPIVDAARRAGTEWYIVEQDTPADPLADVERSFNNLQGLLAGG